MSRVIVICLLAACGSRDTSSAASEEGAETVVEDETVAPEDTPCEHAMDCRVVYDNCGAPHVRRVGNSREPAHVELCPPVEYALTEAVCAGGQCIASRIEDAESRHCESDADCVVIAGDCGAPWAVSSSMREELEREHHRREASLNCAGYYSGTYDMPAACLDELCVVAGR